MLTYAAQGGGKAEVQGVYSAVARTCGTTGALRATPTTWGGGPCRLVRKKQIEPAARQLASKLLKPLHIRQVGQWRLVQGCSGQLRGLLLAYLCPCTGSTYTSRLRLNALVA